MKNEIQSLKESRDTGMGRLTLLLALMCAPMGAAQAQDWNCDAPDKLPQLGMNYCAYQEWQAADVELNAKYKRAVAAMKRLDADLPANQKGAFKSLREAQRAWITFRDKACEAEGYLFRGGSMEPLIVSGCKALLTQQRTKSLGFLIEER